MVSRKKLLQQIAPGFVDGNGGPEEDYAVDGPLWLGLTRGIAGFFGVLALLDVVLAVVTGQQDADYGWIDLTPLPADGARGLLAFCGVALLLFAGTHRLPRAVRPSVIVAVMILVAAAIGNAVSIHRAIGMGLIRDGIPMPAHLVVLLLPVIVGVARGGACGPLRFPVGGAVVLIGFAATAFAFSVGYVSSISKFHQPSDADAIVLLTPTDEQLLEPHAGTLQRLIEAGYANQVMLVQQRSDSGIEAQLRRQVPEGVTVNTVTAASEFELAGALQELQGRLLVVGERIESARVKLAVRQPGRSVRFVVASGTVLDESVLEDIRRLWSAWTRPLTQRVTGRVIAGTVQK